MLKYFYILFLPILGFSQPTITNDIVPTIGSQYTAQFIENPSFDPGPAGANQTWDFSNLQGQLEINFNILDPNETPESDKFPGAAFVWNFVEFESYFYYDSKEDSISQMGTVVATATETTFLVINSDLEDALQFPITYLSSYNYHTEYDNFLFGNNVFSGERDGTLTVDAYGTIITPYGTYEDVLRLKIETSDFGTQATQYAWYDVNSFIPILVYETSDDPNEPSSVYYSDIDETTATNEPQIDHQEYSVYVTGSNSLTLKSTSHLSKLNDFRLFDVNGRMVQAFKNPVINGSSEMELMLKNPLNSGIYFLIFTVAGKSISTPFYIKNN